MDDFGIPRELTAESLRDFCLAYIAWNGNRTLHMKPSAARHFGVSRATIYRKFDDLKARGWWGKQFLLEARDSD